MAISVDQKYSLKGAGWDWGDDCYVILHDLTEKAAREYDATAKEGEDNSAVIKRYTALIRKLFVSGKGMNQGAIVDLTSEDIELLPIKVRNRLFSEMLGVTEDPKGEKPTTEPSSTTTAQ